MLACQLVQATLTGIVADRLFGGPWRSSSATVVDVVVVFVVGEVAPTTWAVQHPERAALLPARPVGALARLPAAADAVAGCSSA